MKLFIIITLKKNSSGLIKSLVEKKYYLTHIPSEGGFLKKKNSTILLGVKDEKQDEVLEIVKKECKPHTEFTNGSIVPTGAGLGEFLPSGSVKIKIGGAIVFVVGVERFVKI